MRPNTYPAWATNEEQDPITGANNKVAPSEEFQLVGLKRGLPLPRAFVNYQFDLVNQWIEYLTNTTLTAVTSTNLDTTPDVSNCRTLIVSNSAATTITDFDTTESNDRIITVFSTNSNTTIQHNSNIVLNGAVDFAMGTNGSVTLTLINSVWYETGRNS